MGFFDKLKRGLNKTKNAIVGKIDNIIKSFRKVDEELFEELEEAISKAEICPIANLNNSFRQKDTGDLDYIRMREKQAVVLKGIYQNIMQIAYLPKQAHMVSEFLGELEQAYHKYNTVTEYLDKLQALGEEMKREALPETREEFEARAILFYVLIQLEELLWIKRRFVIEKERKV